MGNKLLHSTLRDHGSPRSEIWVSGVGTRQILSSACAAPVPSSKVDIALPHKYLQTNNAKVADHRTLSISALTASPTLIPTLSMGKPGKRRRKGEAGDVAADEEKAAIAHITRLPFELIAEILLYSTSPADILSLSQTCKHFCATLVQNPVATFIWKRVRAQTNPPVPDPTDLGFTEPQLANFIYGGGNCVVRSPLPFYAHRIQRLRSRYAAKARTICVHRFPPGYDSVETRSVA